MTVAITFEQVKTVHINQLSFLMENTTTRARVSQRNGNVAYGQPSTGNGYPYPAQPGNPVTGSESGTGEEVIDEVTGANESAESDESGDFNTGSSGSEATPMTVTDGHAPMSNPSYRAAPSRNGEADGGGGMYDESAADEAVDTESVYEAVEGWEEAQPTESGEEAEPIIEASLADVEASEGGPEFFGLIAAAFVPLVKAVLPTLIGQGTKLVTGLVSKKAKSMFSPALLQVLRAKGVNPSILKQLETSEGYSESGDESGGDGSAAIEALAQQIEALEVIIGTDDRVRVMHTTPTPWKRICHLKITAANGKSYLGTGFFIGPKTILTAGHCVYIHGQGGWPKQIVVTPGRNGASTPFNKFTATDFRSVKGWVLNKNRNFDYGVIQLPATAVVSAGIGAFGFGTFGDDFLLNKRLNTAGYPGDKPAGTMWFNGRKAKSVTARTITYDIDTVGGQSGSPVWFKGSDGKRIVVGVHTNGASSGNSATRITKAVFANLKKWRAEASR